MRLLIDGYNLIFAVGLGGAQRGPRHLERARRALIGFLAASLSPAELAATTVVFDAADAPRDRPDAFVDQGVALRFARHYRDADELLEALIQADTSPKQLTVVSSDHRVAQAARRRRAQSIDSEPWYDAIVHRRQSPQVPATAEEGSKPQASAADVEFWRKLTTESDAAPGSVERLLGKATPLDQAAAKKRARRR